MADSAQQAPAIAFDGNNYRLSGKIGAAPTVPTSTRRGSPVRASCSTPAESR